VTTRPTVGGGGMMACFLRRQAVEASVQSHGSLAGGQAEGELELWSRKSGVATERPRRVRCAQAALSPSAHSCPTEVVTGSIYLIVAI
jgi:hypothetical protein